MLQTSNPRQTRAERRAETSSRRGFAKAIAASGGELDTALVDAADTLAGHPQATLLRDGKASFYTSPTACIICSQKRPPAAFFLAGRQHARERRPCRASAPTIGAHMTLRPLRAPALASCGAFCRKARSARRRRCPWTRPETQTAPADETGAGEATMTTESATH
jgi:hypothetical protein